MAMAADAINGGTSTAAAPSFLPLFPSSTDLILSGKVHTKQTHAVASDAGDSSSSQG
jgi:hypothetical protein